jgi:hypothetical protein
MVIFPDLSQLQKNLLSNFYSKPKSKVLFNKLERDKIGLDFKKNKDINKYQNLEISMPAFYFELLKAVNTKKNIQPAVFSECVYTQALAEKYLLTIFRRHSEQEEKKISFGDIDPLLLNDLSPRFTYKNSEDSILLIQAGGAGGVDCALISLIEKTISKIEFKEPYARTSEPDLPKYKDDGFLISSEKFDKKYPQFKSMLEEQIEKKLNIFENIGHNIPDFSKESIEKAVSENYTGSKKADVICTEDEHGYLVMLPSNEVANWAKLEGEIRPSGRNSYKVWSLEKLVKDIVAMGGKINGTKVEIQTSLMEPRIERGGTRKSGLKLNALFFVRIENIKNQGDLSIFNIEDVKQLNPSITAKMKFENLDFDDLKNYYMKKV